MQTHVKRVADQGVAYRDLVQTRHGLLEIPQGVQVEVVAAVDFQTAAHRLAAGVVVGFHGLLAPLRETANYIIDTTRLKPRSLQKQLQEIASSASEVPPLRIEIMSFGFKRGLPAQSDLVFDVRFLPNPYYIESLCRHSGLDEDVRSFVMEHPATQSFMAKVTDLIDFLLPHYQEEGKHRLVIAVGCTGGAHRSVAIAEAIGAHLTQTGFHVDINHRDLLIEQAHWKAGN